MNNALFTGFDIFYPVKNTVKVQRFFTGFCIGSDPVKTALFTGFDIFYPVKIKNLFMLSMRISSY